jgi:hypothetical protein
VLRLARWLWLAAVASSLLLGARALHTRLAARPATAWTARASSDAYLAGLGLGRPAEAIRRALARLPADDAVIFAGPADDPAYFQVLYTVSFLGLPHQVAGLGCVADGGPGQVLVPMDADQTISALVYFRWPPAVTGAQPIAPGLFLLRIPPQPARSQWTSWCSPSPPPSS